VPKEPSSGSSGGKWVLGIVIGVGVFWLIGQSNKQPSSSTPAYTPSTQAASYTTPSPPAPPPEPQAPSRPEEAVPPVGSDLVFSKAQITYCLAEDIRIDASKAGVDRYNDSNVDRFNTMVADYNSRCGSFRYRNGALESARQDIEPYRSQLIIEGRSRFMDSSQSDAQSTPAEVDLSQLTPVDEPPPQPAESQSAADEMFYDLPTTRSRSTPNAIVDVDPINSSAPGDRQSEPPANSWISGSNWYCKDGFRKVGNQCEALIVPDNAFVSGSNWYCKDGFRKVGDECEALIVPQNAFVSGSNWYCKDGFMKVGNQCDALIVPDNAFVSGSNWYCKDGFKRVADKCVSVFE
jgi:hypothetical protein